MKVLVALKKAKLYVKHFANLGMKHILAIFKSVLAGILSVIFKETSFHSLTETVNFIRWTESGMFTTDRAKNRSKTFPGIARAMAEQWGRISY